MLEWMQSEMRRREKLRATAMKGIQGAMAHREVGEEKSMNNEELDWESEDVRDLKKLIHITSCWVM
jgi:uncharacterized protein YqeY